MVDEIDPNHVLDWIKGIDDDIERDARQIPVEDSEWYIISNKFLERWKELITFNEDNLSPDSLEIDNTELILNSPDLLALPSEYIVKQDLRLGKDYEILPPKA